MAIEDANYSDIRVSSYIGKTKATRVHTYTAYHYSMLKERSSFGVDCIGRAGVLPYFPSRFFTETGHWAGRRGWAPPRDT